MLYIDVTLRYSLDRDLDFFEQVQDRFNIYLIFGFLLIFMSPAAVYYRMVPKAFIIDENRRMLEIRKRSKTLKYQVDKIRFYQTNTIFFSILEIHATFRTHKNEPFEKLANVIVVPNRGLSWNGKKMKEIAAVMRELNIEEIENRKPLPIWDYLFEDLHRLK